MAEETVTKRLHVAGLTPGITAQDLTARFASFGTVLAVDGLGLQDGVGQPRKFAYVTLTATPEKLRRCMNLLSGTHYKGAKLRIGEAKPDWHEHWEKEHKEAVVEEGRPNKKRKMGVEGKEARDMEVVSVENVEGKPYWKLTALQHLIRPLRMRPLHPLPPPTSTLPAPKPGSSKPADKPSKRKLKALEPPNRARRVVIDPREWGAVHLTGGLLEAGDVNLPKRVVMRDGAEEGEKEREEKLKKKKKKKKQDVEMDDPPAAAEPAPTPALNPKPKKPTSTPAAPAPEGSDPLLLAITAEQSATLSLLKQMFGEGLEKADEGVMRMHGEMCGRMWEQFKRRGMRERTKTMRKKGTTSKSHPRKRKTASQKRKKETRPPVTIQLLSQLLPMSSNGQLQVLRLRRRSRYRRA
ncbi:hypothetical protein CALCODRAFT_496951 [Calocera cornea HHB12733]|uniref:RRM domain-containing protein n=1 Tax=Calocera cornea HHB12733 TaxID=1353952 RepID=A0A165FIF3_9BASI|nr:hypothetical protein CALCODRAFT_496951 [Calocera cornea HHB12733]